MGATSWAIMAVAYFLAFTQLSLLQVAQAKDFYLVPHAGIQGADITCGQKDDQGLNYPSCAICGGVRNVTDACKDNPACTGFTMIHNRCGYLKKGTATQYREEYNSYVTGSAPKGSYKLIQRASVTGYEIDCKSKDRQGQYQPFCEVCGGVAALARSCSANPKCKAFDMGNSYCGYLKSANKQVYTEDFDSYQKV